MKGCEERAKRRCVPRQTACRWKCVTTTAPAQRCHAVCGRASRMLLQWPETLPSRQRLWRVMHTGLGHQAQGVKRSHGPLAELAGRAAHMHGQPTAARPSLLFLRPSSGSHSLGRQCRQATNCARTPTPKVSHAPVPQHLPQPHPQPSVRPSCSPAAPSCAAAAVAGQCLLRHCASPRLARQGDASSSGGPASRAGSWHRRWRWAAGPPRLRCARHVRCSGGRCGG